jgi:coproporphyrinogen III oxidase
MTTIDIFEWVGLNVAGVIVLAVPNYIHLFPELSADAEFILKMAVGVSLVTLNIAKFIESTRRTRREDRDHKKNNP